MRVQGWLTEDGRRAFEEAREQLRHLHWKHTGREKSMSDGDVIEYLARGMRAALRQIKALK